MERAAKRGTEGCGFFGDCSSSTKRSTSRTTRRFRAASCAVATGPRRGRAQRRSIRAATAGERSIAAASAAGGGVASGVAARASRERRTIGVRCSGCSGERCFGRSLDRGGLVRRFGGGGGSVGDGGLSKSRKAASASDAAEATGYGDGDGARKPRCRPGWGEYPVGAPSSDESRSPPPRMQLNIEFLVRRQKFKFK